MNEATIERVAKYLASRFGGDVYDESDWGVYASAAMQVIELAEDQWKPIETAPKDGEEVLVSPFKYNDPTKGRFYVVATFEDGRWLEPDGFTPLYPPTHWCPVPKLIDT
jgi:hypothetical protein